MRVLLDTNIILRAAQPSLPIWPTINDSRSSLVAQNYRLCIVPQTIYEFWVVLTRPISQNGFGLNPNEAMESIKRTRSNFLILLDERGIFNVWFGLVTQFGVSGKGAHDARIVAAMQKHGIRYLVTFNKDDFKRFPITALTPDEIVSGVQFI